MTAAEPVTDCSCDYCNPREGKRSWPGEQVSLCRGFGETFHRTRHSGRDYVRPIVKLYGRDAHTEGRDGAIPYRQWHHELADRFMAEHGPHALARVLGVEIDQRLAERGETL